MRKLRVFQRAGPHGQRQNLFHFFFLKGNVVFQRLFVDAGSGVSCQVHKLQKFLPAEPEAFVKTAVTSVFHYQIL